MIITKHIANFVLSYEFKGIKLVYKQNKVIRTSYDKLAHSSEERIQSKMSTKEIIICDDDKYATIWI